MILAPGYKLGPYEILSSIGSGGMGEVWKARDTRLGRIVAIKKVREQHSERFKREARSIAALNHPNICQIFDIGDDYLVLEYIEGKPLYSPLPEQEAVRLAVQIATALEAAHRKGIIHRDLKPGNILVTDEGTVKVLDFGLAKLYERDQSISSLPTEEFPATEAGAILGTVAYMSPEQAQGQTADARSDIFSFGLVLYEMLSGRRAFSGDSNFTLIEAIVRKEPPPLKASPVLEKIVMRCLDKDPSARYRTMAEVNAALEKAVQGKITVSSEEPQPIIAVLPFVNMSGDREQEYFSDGLAEEIINALTKIPGLKVIARTSAFAFKGKDQDIRHIAESLNATNILEGSVRKAGNRIRVTAQLIDTSDGTHLWSERYDRDMTDVFDIQDEISQAISDKLSVHLTGDHRIVRRHTGNVEAYNLYLKGRYHLYRTTPESLEKSREYFEQAIAMDPKCAAAWFGLSMYYEVLGFSGEESLSRCRHAVLKALDLDKMLPQAHSVIGALHAVEFNWKDAEREFHRALELGPENTDVLLQYVYFYLMPMKRLDEAIPSLQKAVQLDPLSQVVQERLGFGYFLTQQWDLAIAQYRTALELDPHHWMSYMFMGLTCLETGEPDDAIHAGKTAVRLSGQSPFPIGYLGYTCARVGRIDEARRHLRGLEELAKKSYLPVAVATIYVGLGEIDRAFDWLEKAAVEHDALILTIPSFFLFDPLRSHPRYKALLRKMNLEV